MLTIKYSVKKGPGFTATLRRVQKRLTSAAQDVSPVVTYFSAELRRSIQKNFRDGGNPRWAANSKNTVAAKGHARPLIGPSGQAKLEQATRIVNTYAPPSRYEVDVWVPQIGAYHMEGWKGGTIRPVKAKALRFVVAEDRGDFIKRRRRALERRRAGNTKVKIPSRPGKVVVFAKEVKHPGYKARPFVVVRPSLIRDAWRTPLRRFLIEGKAPGQ